MPTSFSGWTTALLAPARGTPIEETLTRMFIVTLGVVAVAAAVVMMSRTGASSADLTRPEPIGITSDRSVPIAAPAPLWSLPEVLVRPLGGDYVTEPAAR